MASEHLVPPGVDPTDAALLRRAYDLRNQGETDALYSEWAASYDRTMLDGLGYTAPTLLVDQFAAVVTWRDRPIVDLGCGTGLVGAGLARHGFTTVDGLDVSQPMMAQAATLGVYRSLFEADLTQPLGASDGKWSAAICNGTFTSGHVGAGCLDEIVRTVADGGWLSCAVHHSVWDSLGFGTAFHRLTAAGLLETVEMLESRYYASSTGTDGRLCLFRVAH
jgi:SAM-dependent methyltransferase